jgi:2-polyprenyl-6-methoxyphenol hydroxylase-like FAD-dependent oxidoreductase
MTSMPAPGRVLIVGGGIAGMALAIALHRAGIGCEVVEINPQWTVGGLGIGLGGPALRALKMIGLIDQCVARGFGYSSFNAADAEGNVTGTVQMPRLNGPDYPATIGIMRQDLHAVLQQALKDSRVPVRLGVTVASLEQDDGGVDVTFTDGTAGRYDLAVAADGANSKLRDMLFGAQWRPKYTGQAVWRATVSRPAEVQSRTSYHGPRHKAGYNPVSERQMYLYLVQNLPTFARLADAQLPEVLRELLSDFGGLIGAARDEIDDPNVIAYRPITSLILPPPWHQGRVILIGDAAHTITPHMAAGAGVAIEDSIVLAELLRDEPSLAAALETFMTRRFERCRLVVDNSLQLGEWEKAPHTPRADPVGVEGQTVRALAQPF